MEETLDFNIDGITGFVAAITPVAAFGAVAVAAGLLAPVGARRGIDGTLNNRGSRLGLYGRSRLGHHILCGGRGKNRQWNRGHLHTKPQNYYAGALLLGSREESLKHLVADSWIEKLNKAKSLVTVSAPVSARKMAS